jgi:hypothetical protein
VQLEGLGQLKNPVTSFVIEPVTFWLEKHVYINQESNIACELYSNLALYLYVAVVIVYSFLDYSGLIF